MMDSTAPAANPPVENEDQALPGADQRSIAAIDFGTTVDRLEVLSRTNRRSPLER